MIVSILIFDDIYDSSSDRSEEVKESKGGTRDFRLKAS